MKKMHDFFLVVGAIGVTTIIGSLCLASFLPETTAVVWSKLGPTSPIDKTTEELIADKMFREDKEHFVSRAKTLKGKDLFAGDIPIGEPIKIRITSIRVKDHLRSNQKAGTGSGFIGYSGQGKVLDETSEFGVGVGKTKTIWWRASYIEGSTLKKDLEVEVLPISSVSAVFLPTSNSTISLASNKGAK